MNLKTIKKASYYISWVIALSFLWCVLHLEFTAEKIAFGAAISTISIVITERLILRESLIKIFPMNLFGLTYYLFVLMFELFKTANTGVRSVFTRNLDFDFVRIHTDLKDDYSRVMLANSISLLSGTITVDITDDDLLVLWMEPRTTDEKEAGDIIKKNLENALKVS